MNECIQQPTTNDSKVMVSFARLQKEIARNRELANRANDVFDRALIPECPETKSEVATDVPVTCSLVSIIEDAADRISIASNILEDVMSRSQL